MVALDIGSDAIKAALFILEEKHNSSGEVIDRKAVVKGFSIPVPCEPRSRF